MNSSELLSLQIYCNEKKKQKIIVYLVVVDVKELKMKKDKKTNNKVRIKKRIKKIFK